MKSKIYIFIVFIICLIITGCENYVELNDIGIVNSIGISKTNNLYEISINMMRPKQNNLEENIIYTQTGETLDKAFNKLYLVSSKTINLSHLELLILNKNLKKEDYDNIKNFFLSRIESRNNFNVIILENYDTKNIFKNSTMDINNLIKTNSNKIGTVFPKTFDEIIEDILTINKSYIPTIEITDEVKILGYRIVYKNEKLLSYTESITHNFITNKIKNCNLTYENINIKVTRTNTNITIKDDVININIFSIIEASNNKDKNVYETILQKNIDNYIKGNDLEYIYQQAQKHNKNYYNKLDFKNLKLKINITTKLNKEIVNYE